MAKNPTLCKNDGCYAVAIAIGDECVRCAFSLDRMLEEIADIDDEEDDDGTTEV